MPDVCQVPLTKGKVALVDAADYERVAAHTCSAVFVRGRWYATLYAGPPQAVKLHRFILEAPPRAQIGFVNGDSLDCRRSNLRVRKGAGFYQKAPQGDLFPRETLPVVETRTPAPRGRYVGVSRLPHGGFGARVCAGNRTRWIGTFATDRDAALAVNVAARLLRLLELDVPTKKTGARIPRTWVDVNDVPAAVPVDELEAAIASLAARLGTARHSYRYDDKKATGETA